MRTDIIYSLLCLAFTSHASPVVDARAANPTVSLASGVVVGTATRVSNQPSVTGLASAYLGIPFASSPPLRFAPPTAPSPWKEPLVAQKLPPACLQAFGTGATAAETELYFNTPPPPAGESEDCLYLNVYAPPDASPSNLKPVMFWIYGVSAAAHRRVNNKLTSTGKSCLWHCFLGHLQRLQPRGERGCCGGNHKLPH
jgi:acetylcholinesterase/carboxylesterase 2